MKKAGRRFHRIFRAVFAAALALAITGANLAPAAAVTWADVNELKDEANGLDAEKKELQAKLDALADDKSQAVARKELLDQQIANTEAQIANTQAQIDRYAALITQTEAELVEAALADLEAEQDALWAEAQRLSDQLVAQQAANGQSTESNPGGYIWPVNSRYITSTVGGRASPGGIGSTNHKGTDIGRVGYTSSIYAAKSGTVIVSQYSSSYGNYVVISHGSGNTTLYAHMSSRKVSVGQYVNQGDVIGITGSTGNSTGPHLHFEVTENGVRVNPLNDGAEPKMGYLTGYTLSKSA